MIERHLSAEIDRLLATHPAVAMLGPRQVGKTTLALAVAESRPAVYLDLESPADRAKLDEPELYLAAHEDQLVILDEIQRVPELFSTLRGLIDAGRRRGRRAGRFLILGSASKVLLRQSAESLAGRIVYVELGPFNALEIGHSAARMDRLWVRGGFPESYLAAGEPGSVEWRQSFVRTYLERDIPAFVPRIPTETLRRFWVMLAHGQGSLLNAARLAAGLGVSGQSVGRYVDLLVDLMLVRRLTSWQANVGKRLVKSPKIYVRDSGVAHTLLGIADLEALLGHPVVGMSWEAFVIESLIAAAPLGTESFFYRTAVGAEIDLLLILPDSEMWAVEVKRSLTPRPARGFHVACEDLQPQRRYVVYPGTETFPLAGGIEAIGVRDVAALLR